MRTFTLAEIIEMFGEITKTNHTSTPNQSTSFEVGKAYLIRTVTMTQTGRVVKITDTDIALEDAAWIADTGRFYTALKTGNLEEVEPFPAGCFVGRGAIVDFAPWPHPLPTQQK